jgi:hypothetical protein
MRCGDNAPPLGDAEKETVVFAFITRTKMALVLALALALGSASLVQGAAAPSLAAQAANPQARGTLHVVAIGISESKNRRNVTLGARSNVEAVVTRLEAQKGKLYKEVRVRKVLGREATAANALAALDGLKRDVRPGDRVVVYFNAHGGVIRGQWRMTMTDAEIGFWAVKGTVTRDELRARLEKLPAPVVLILDSCHAGAFGDGVGNRAVSGQAGLVVFAACLGDQYGINSLKLRRSLFSLALIEAMEGKADANGDGVVTLAEVDAYVASRLPQLEKEVGPSPEIRILVEKELGRLLPPQTPTLSRPSTIASGLPLALVPARPA